MSSHPYGFFEVLGMGLEMSFRTVSLHASS